ncbi:fatty acid desaturase [Azospirillum sp. SYSU D00513]|uniref:fatty acid desaturase n=1 Tax=Azospirillum sp. SYSU D00513 TaxID=2812561 RepID=UPI001A9782CD|nr:fatty acid desaturase [Azospirillum sp. SYSU D00513]
MTIAVTATPEPSPAVTPSIDSGADAGSRKRTARFWAERLAAYKEPEARRSIGQLASTILPLAGLLTLMGLSLQVGYWLTLLLAVPAALFLARLWILQHDCGHGAFFRTSRANDWVGRCLGVLTVTPYEMWRRDHAVHHATSGNLDKRGFGDIDTLTVREYLALSPWKRFCYRVYRNPLVLFGVGPTYLFLIRFRFPLGPWSDVRAWLSVIGSNAATAAAVGLFIYLFGAAPVLGVWLPVVLLAATIGVWMFYIQHQFDTVYWRSGKEWDFHDAAIHGSSFYDLPGWLHWMTAYVGYHHVHHLASRIPNYRLPDCHRAIAEFQAVRSITLKESLRSIRLALFDEDSRRLIGFGELKAKAA